MSDRRTHVAVYRSLTRLYPSSFRRSYDADLIALFADQLDDESSLRVWLRTLRDLAVSVPTQRLETHMNRPSARIVTAASGLVAGTASLLALTIGSGPALPVFLIIAVIAGSIAYWSWRNDQPLRADGAAAKSWWKVLLAGPALATVTIGAISIPWPQAMDLGDNAYWLVVIAFMTSLALAALGLLLGTSALIGRHHTRHPGASPA
jgi:hypothetical protein